MKIINGILSNVHNEDIINGEFIIPDSVTEIGEMAFYSCTNLKSIIIPDSITKLWDAAFLSCKNLTSIDIPNSVTEIGDYAFDNCIKLKNINVSKDNTHYSSIDGVLFNKNKKKLIKYPEDKKSKKYIIPDSIIEIGHDSFDNCQNLTSIIMPNSVIKISAGAFNYCKNLTSIDIPNSVTEIGDRAFAYCNSLESIVISDSVTKIGLLSFYNCRALQSKKGNYKAFNNGLICMDMQYIPNEWNKIKGEIKICEWGLHYVTNLFNLFNYYYGDLEKDIEIWEVEVGYIVVDNDYDSKKATNSIKPIRKLKRKEIINILNNK